MAAKTPLFHQGHYNAIAKEIREIFPQAQVRGKYIESDHRKQLERRATLVALAINLAKRFKKDNPDFDHLRWLDQCSPNVDLYPLSELWED